MARKECRTVKQSTKSIVMVLGLFLVMSIALYSCGGGGDGGGGGTPPTSTVTVVTCPVSGTTDISIVNSTASGFNPGSEIVTIGTTVKWTNNDTTTHTVTSTTVPANGAFNATLNPGATVCLNFSAAGAFNYQCSIHPVMQGLVTVQ